MLLNNIAGIFRKWHTITHIKYPEHIKETSIHIIKIIGKKINAKIPKPLVLEIISQTINKEPYQLEVNKNYQKGGGNELTPEDIKNIIANDTKLKNIFYNLTNNYNL